MFREITTYQDLKDALAILSEEQLKQPVQVIEPSPFWKKELQPALAIGTVQGMELDGSRSSVDNRYHAEEVVILTDSNPFAEDGAIAYGAGKKVIYAILKKRMGDLKL